MLLVGRAHPWKEGSTPDPSRAFPLHFLGEWATGWVVAWDWRLANCKSHLGWRLARGGEGDVSGASGHSSPLLFPGLPLVPGLPVGWGVRGGGQRQVVCVPQPGSPVDESRLNGEPGAERSRPTLTHLSPRSFHALMEGSGACSILVGGIHRCPRLPYNLAQGLESRQGAGVGTFSRSQLSPQGSPAEVGGGE